jgi:hypothetical protein
VLGASPDGIINRPATHHYHHQNMEDSAIIDALGMKPGVIEIKCPFKSRNMTISEAITTVKDFCLGLYNVFV